MFKKIALASALLSLVLFAVVAPTVDAGPGCSKKSGGCKATGITFTPDSPNPTIPCPNWSTIYRFDATITCGVGFGDPVSDYVCGASAVPISFSLGGQTHTFAPAPGRTWDDAIANCADYLVYTVS